MPRPFALSTDRLHIRLLDRRDVTEFTRYRNLDEVSRFQDWPLPYTRDQAHELAEDGARLGQPTPGEWIQLAIVADGELVGDLAVWLDDAGQLAMVGYTLAPERQGRGFAAEAVGRIVDWLFSDRHVHRIAATIDPRNLPSARVLERCGFEYVGTARGAALQRGEWTDDARFSLLEPDRRAWVERRRDEPERVELAVVTHDMVRRLGEVEPSYSQRHLVAPVLVSMAEALVPPIEDGELVEPWYRAIVADSDIVGFLMVAEPFGNHPHPFLWRLVVDRRHQGRGIGRGAVLELARLRRASGATHLDVSYHHDAVGTPAPFYRSLGFVPTGEFAEGEEIARLDLSTLADRTSEMSGGRTLSAQLDE